MGHLYAEQTAASPAAAAEAAPAAVTALAEAAEAADADDSESAERQNMKEVPACVHVVNNRFEAQRVAGLLTKCYRHQVFGADTEVNAARPRLSALIRCAMPCIAEHDVHVVVGFTCRVIAGGLHRCLKGVAVRARQGHLLLAILWQRCRLLRRQQPGRAQDHAVGGHAAR